MTVTRPSPTVMVVSWIPLNYFEARGFISHYTVTYSPALQMNGRKRQAPNEMTKNVIGMDGNTTRIEGLDQDTNYTVRVSATNGAGTSNFSLEVLTSSPTRTQGVSVAAIGGAAGVVVALLLLVIVCVFIIVIIIR